jgi:predicted KAP-like P-loop ATPase
MTKSVPPSKTLEAMFYEGRPIEKFSDDQLGRKNLSRFFADGIARHDGHESLVLAVNSPWGEGKTSFKNMTLDLLAQEYTKRVVTLTFTPWEWASQTQVSEAFFKEIAKQLEVKDSSEIAKNVASRLRTLGWSLGLAGDIVASTGAVLELQHPGSAILAYGIRKGLKKARVIAVEAEKQVDQRAEANKKSLPQIKEDLRNALQTYLDKEQKLILVVVDDIDRLSPDEIRLVFQLVRVNADFPALVFLLLYDQEFVVKSLDGFFHEASSRFLEKIVQFQLTLPVLADNHLRDHAIGELKKLFAKRPVYSALFDVLEFIDFWALGIGVYVTNLRQCGRLLSSYEFYLGVFGSTDAEVNPIDLLVLEVFRLFEPQLYQSLYRNGNSLFPDFQETVMMHMEEKTSKEDPWKKHLDEIAKAVVRPEARTLLKKIIS